MKKPEKHLIEITTTYIKVVDEQDIESLADAAANIQSQYDLDDIIANSHLIQIKVADKLPPPGMSQDAWVKLFMLTQKTKSKRVKNSLPADKPTNGFPTDQDIDNLLKDILKGP